MTENELNKLFADFQARRAAQPGGLLAPDSVRLAAEIKRRLAAANLPPLEEILLARTIFDDLTPNPLRNENA
jgi:hypothetical protein